MGAAAPEAVHKFYDISLRYAPTPRAKAKLNANTNSGRGGCSPISPAKKSAESPRPIPISTGCEPITKSFKCKILNVGKATNSNIVHQSCLLYTSDAADDLLCVD